MNPVLLKPQGDSRSELTSPGVRSWGRPGASTTTATVPPAGRRSAGPGHPSGLPSRRRLVLDGGRQPGGGETCSTATSPILRLAQFPGARCLLVADIVKGVGVLPVIGTLALLRPVERPVGGT